MCSDIFSRTLAVSSVLDYYFLSLFFTKAKTVCPLTLAGSSALDAPRGAGVPNAPADDY